MLRQSASSDPAVHHGKEQASKRGNGLQWQNPIPERGKLLVGGESGRGVGNPARRESHEPFEEVRCGTGAARLVDQRRGRCESASDVFPSGYGVGVSSPAVKMSSISDHNVSDSSFLLGEPSGP